ncbi:hypothetical protein GJV76_12085 [Myroides sp. BIT-d1]|uniref:Membrane-anchored protein n=1 Tax=Myroides albus TaxID=2562892 RepID=A0A6I3LQB9_9FLAO|nr:GDYXXLXY domain-containing protein [Myroides albus]MTG98861.1 hypothetical protein [Myroides albus]
MSKNRTNYVILITTVLIVLFFIRAVFEKEQTIKEGQLVLLELAPVDPRSLMQGDYMRLNYKISTGMSDFLNDSLFVSETNDSLGITQDNFNKAPITSYKDTRGFVLLNIDEKGIGHLVDLSSKIKEKGDNQIYVKFFNKTNWNFNIGAESFFFQEGEAEKFEKAVYGGLRVDEKGNSVLVGMYDKDLKLIE